MQRAIQTFPRGQRSAVQIRQQLSGHCATRILDYALSLNARITDAQAVEWAKGTAEDWANESHGVAVESVYRDVPADGGPPKIDQAYVDRAGPVVEQQLERAGVRLAAVLTRTFRPTQTQNQGE